MANMSDDTRRTITDVGAMRALSHPDRMSILWYLLAGSARTATDCATEIGSTASACSYHLRQLERYGFAERAEASLDQRQRPWRAAALGFSLGGDWVDDSPVGRTARVALGQAGLVENERLIQRYVESIDAVDPAWQNASDFHNFELLMTSEELQQLNDAVADLCRPFRAPNREDPPPEADAVHVVYQAFPRIESA